MLVLAWAAGPLLYGAGLWSVARLDGQSLGQAVCFSPWTTDTGSPLRLAAAAEDAIRRSVVPAYRLLLQFLAGKISRQRRYNLWPPGRTVLRDVEITQRLLCDGPEHRSRHFRTVNRPHRGIDDHQNGHCRLGNRGKPNKGSRIILLGIRT